MTPPDEATQTIAFLANELRRAMESVTALHQVATQQKAEIERLKALVPPMPPQTENPEKDANGG